MILVQQVRKSDVGGGDVQLERHGKLDLGGLHQLTVGGSFDSAFLCGRKRLGRSHPPTSSDSLCSFRSIHQLKTQMGLMISGPRR